MDLLLLILSRDRSKRTEGYSKPSVRERPRSLVGCRVSRRTSCNRNENANRLGRRGALAEASRMRDRALKKKIENK